MKRSELIDIMQKYLEENGNKYAEEYYPGAERELIESLADKILSTGDTCEWSVVAYNVAAFVYDIAVNIGSSCADQWFPDYSDNDPIIYQGAYEALIKYLDSPKW